jgi:hypothetical protein
MVAPQSQQESKRAMRMRLQFAPWSYQLTLTVSHSQSTGTIPDSSPTPEKSADLADCAWRLLGAIFVGTHIPGGTPLLPPNGWDKLAHFAAFAGLATLLATTWQLAAGHLTLRHLCVVWFAIVLYAAFDEWTQTPVGRDASLWDWTADAAGALLAIALFAWLRSRSGAR